MREETLGARSLARSTAPLVAILLGVACTAAQHNVTAVEPRAIERSRADAPQCLEHGDRVPLGSDGTLRCAQLPISVTFPEGTTDVGRMDDVDYWFGVLDERATGALSFSAGPIRQSIEDPRAFVDRKLEQAVRMLGRPDIETGQIRDVELAGVRAGRAISFFSSSYSGEVRGILWDGWFAAVVAGGQEGGPLHHGTPLAAAFLDSVRFVDISADPLLTFIRWAGPPVPLLPEIWPFSLPPPTGSSHMAAYQRGADGDGKLVVVEVQATFEQCRSEIGPGVDRLVDIVNRGRRSVRQVHRLETPTPGLMIDAEDSRGERTVILARCEPGPSQLEIFVVGDEPFEVLRAAALAVGRVRILPQP